MLFLFLLFASSVFLLYRFQRLQTLKTLTGHNVSLRLSEGSPAKRAHQEVILPFMSMIDDARLQDKGFEKIPPRAAGGGRKRLIVWILLLGERRPVLLGGTRSHR